MEAVNLLPAYARPGHPWAAVGKDLSPRRVATPAGVAACVIALGLGLGYLHERSVVNDRRATLSEVQAQVAVADAKAAPLRAAQAAAAVRMAAAGTVSANRVVLGAAARQTSARVCRARSTCRACPCSRRRRSASGGDADRRPPGRRVSRQRASRRRTCGSRSSSTGSRAAVALERDARVEHER
jgi:hypothetical protein